MKRLIDLLFTLILIPIIIPSVIIFILISFFLIGKFPVISQERMTALDKNRIKIYKIRTIKNSQEFNNLNSSKTVFFKHGLQQYVPAFCIWLRKSGMDEILQIFNVLKGEMSLVGPRPFCESDLVVMSKENPYFYKRRCKINSKPGLTGYWQVNCKRELGAEDLVHLDEYYEKNKSLVLDIKIMIKTLFIVLSASHSDAIVDINKTEAGLSFSQPSTEAL